MPAAPHIHDASRRTQRPRSPDRANRDHLTRHVRDVVPGAAVGGRVRQTHSDHARAGSPRQRQPEIATGVPAAVEVAGVRAVGQEERGLDAIPYAAQARTGESRFGETIHSGFDEIHVGAVGGGWGSWRGVGVHDQQDER